MDYVTAHTEALTVALQEVQEESFPWYPCGFAEVRLPGTSAFARAMRKAGIASPVYGGGMRIRIPLLSQKMTYKAAVCEAYVRELSKTVTVPGIRVWQALD